MYILRQNYDIMTPKHSNTRSEANYIIESLQEFVLEELEAGVRSLVVLGLATATRKSRSAVLSNRSNRASIRLFLRIVHCRWHAVPFAERLCYNTTMIWNGATKTRIGGHFAGPVPN